MGDAERRQCTISTTGSLGSLSSVAARPPLRHTAIPRVILICLIPDLRPQMIPSAQVRRSPSDTLDALPDFHPVNMAKTIC